MPNHIHFILQGNRVSLSQIISTFKRYTIKEIRAMIEAGGNMPPLRNEKIVAVVEELLKERRTIWQKSFRDRIIRNQKEYEVLWQYIRDNPLQWEIDTLYNET